MKAVILAGGKGTRLAPYTTVLPKPLMPLGDMPILEILLRRLRFHNFNEIIISVGYLGALVEAYFGSGEKLGMKIRYSYESDPLGTAGPLALIDNLDETFFLMNGDILSDINFSKMLEFHKEKEALATVGLATKKVNIDLGVIKADSESRIVDYIEKPVLNYSVSMGVYVFEPQVVDFIKGVGRLDLPDLIKKMLSAQKRVLGFDSQSIWYDIGRHEDYQKAGEIFENNKAKFLEA